MIKKYKKVATYVLEMSEEEKNVLVTLVSAYGNQVDNQELNNLDESALESVKAKLSTEEKMVYGKKGEEVDEQGS